MTRDSVGNPLTPGHNVDHVDIDAGMRQAKTFGYDTVEHSMEIQYNLQRWARGEEEQADHSMARSLSGVSYTDWRAILATAIATAEPAECAMKAPDQQPVEPTEHVGCFCGSASTGEHCHACSTRYNQLVSADYCRLQQMKASPPAGWFHFGTHIDREGPLEFYGQEFAEDGMPIWERPI